MNARRYLGGINNLPLLARITRHARSRSSSFVRSSSHSSAEGIIRANEHRIIYIYIGKGLEEVRERGGSPVVVWDTGVSKVKSAGVSRLNLELILLVT